MVAGKLTIPVLGVLGVLFLSHPADAAEQPTFVSTPPVINSLTTPVSSGEEPGHLHVTTYDVEIGQTLSIPADHPSFYLVKTPAITEIREMRSDALILSGKKMGETM